MGQRYLEIAVWARWARAALAALLMIGLAACGGSDDPAVAPPPPAATIGSATIDAAGGTVDGPDGVRLTVPAGTVATPVTFRIARDSTGAPELRGLNAVSPVYAVTPHGQAFEGSARLSIPLSAAPLLPAGARPLLLKAEPGGKWRVLENVSDDPSRLAVDIDGLSFYVLGSCTSTDAAWTINAVDCPGVDHRLQLTLFDADGQPILRGTSPNQPLWYVTDAPQTILFNAFWRRPEGTNRTDQLAVVGLPGGFNSTGFRSTWTNEVIDVTPDFGSYGKYFNVTIDPAQVAGANGPNGRLLRVRAYASYTTTAFRIPEGNVPVGFVFEVEIPILVRYNGALPAITQQPANLGVTEGQPANFTVQASVTPTAALTYQWSRRAGNSAAFAPIAGATAATFGLPTTALTDSGAQFRVVVCSAPTRCLTSSPATLTVTQAVVAPGFTMQPASIAVVAGQTASFGVTATGNPLPRIDWQSAPANDPGNFTALSVAPGCVRTDPPASGTSTAATCTVGPLAVGDSGRRYRAAATNSATTVTSTVATVTVNPAPVAPTITQHPQPQTTTVGGSAAFNVTATGTAPLAYAWRLGGNLPSVNSAFTVGTCTGNVTYSDGGATATFSNLAATCNGLQASVVVSNGVIPDATSNGATLTVNPVTQGLALLAGDIGGFGTLDGTGTAARVVFSAQNGIAFDASGTAYFSDHFAHRVRKVTPAGVVTTLAGITSTLRGPSGVAVDAAGNVYVAEYNADRISRITPAGVVSVWAGGVQGDQDGTGTQAQFAQPYGLAIDVAGNLYVSERPPSRNHKIRKISPTQVVTTFFDFGAASGGGTLATDASGNVYSAQGSVVMRITSAGVASVFAGSTSETGSVDGTGAAARFYDINGIAIAGDGNLYVTDNNTIRRITPAAVVTRVSGGAAIGDGAGAAAGYESATAIGAAPGGDLLIGDVATMRKLTPVPNFYASTFLGKRLQTGTSDGDGAAARFRSIGDAVVDAAGNTYVAAGDRIRKVTPGGTVTTVAVTPARYLAIDASGVLVAADTFRIWRVTAAGVVTLLAGMDQGYVDGTGTSASFYQIGGMAVDAGGNVFVAESLSHTIRRVTPAGVVTTYAGAPDLYGSTDGPALAARFNSPNGLAIDTGGNLYIADSGSLTIRRISAAGVVSTVAGTPNAIGSVDGTGAEARFRAPNRLAVDGSGHLLVGDGSTLRRVTPAGVVTTVLGVDGESAVRLGASPRLNRVAGMTVRPNARIVLTSEAAVLEVNVP